MLTSEQAKVVREYYKELDIADLSIINWKFHHIKFKKINGRFMRINDSISKPEQLLHHLRKHSPADAYFTPVTWLDPVMVRRTPGSLDIMLSAPLYFDIDQREQEPPTWGKTKEETTRLIDFIETKYGLEPDLVIFSGREGFHLYYWNWVDSRLAKAAPRRRLIRFVKSRSNLYKKLRNKGFLLDRAVLVDPYRVLRIPQSLSSKTLLKAIRVSSDEINDFSPEKAAIKPLDFYTRENLVDWQNYG